jgi:hypothetical protein
MFCFHIPALLRGKYLYADTYLWPFGEAKFCGVPSCVSDKLGCAADEKRLQNTGLDNIYPLPSS